MTDVSENTRLLKNLRFREAVAVGGEDKFQAKLRSEPRRLRADFDWIEKLCEDVGSETSSSSELVWMGILRDGNV